MAKLRSVLLLLIEQRAHCLPTMATIRYGGIGTDFVTCTSSRIGCSSTELRETNCSLLGREAIRIYSGNRHLHGPALGGSRR
jgi:hypothetical protein